MALSDKAKKRFIACMAKRKEAEEILTAIESGGNPVAATVANFGATTNVGTTDGSGGAGDAALAVDVESRLDAIEAKINAALTSLKNAGIMAS